MSISRRQTLAILGGGTIVAASAGAGVFLSTRTPSKALMPWQQAGDYDEPRRRALSYAILAPNPHNRQPWLVDLKQNDTVVLYRDKTRTLPETDPYSRQLTIGLGCFLELLVIAASQTHHAVSLELYPNGEDGPVAIATFADGATPDPLFAHVMQRRSCKEPFQEQQIAAALRTELADYANIIADAGKVRTLRKLTLDAWETEANTPAKYKESVDLMRLGKREINASPDGIDLGGPFLDTLIAVGILSRKSQLDPDSTGFKEGVKRYRAMLSATPAYAALTTPDNSRALQIDAGRRWLRLNLKTTELGLALHPVSQALQEFSEMAPHYQRAHELLAETGHTVQMLGRLGYGPATAPSPRWPLETRIVV